MLNRTEQDVKREQSKTQYEMPCSKNHKPTHNTNYFKVDKQAMIRNRYTRIPYPALDTKWERDTYN